MGEAGSRKPTPCQRAPAKEALKELFRLAAEDGTAIDGMTEEEAIAHMRRVRERLWNAKHAYRPRRRRIDASSRACGGNTETEAMSKTKTRRSTPKPCSRARSLLEELIQGCAEHGTAVDGMTKEEVIAHMRRVRKRLWEAKHAYRPRRE